MKARKEMKKMITYLKEYLLAIAAVIRKVFMKRKRRQRHVVTDDVLFI
jgi:hypothetical protein